MFDDLMISEISLNKNWDLYIQVCLRKLDFFYYLTYGKHFHSKLKN